MNRIITVTVVTMFLAACSARPGAVVDDDTDGFDTSVDTDLDTDVIDDTEIDDVPCLNIDGDFNPDGSERCDEWRTDPIVVDPTTPYVYLAQDKLPSLSYMFLVGDGLGGDNPWCSNDLEIKFFHGEYDWPSAFQADYARVLIPDYVTQFYGNARQIEEGSCENDGGPQLWANLDALDPAVVPNMFDEDRLGLCLQSYGTGHIVGDTIACQNMADDPDNDGGDTDEVEDTDEEPELETWYRDYDEDGFGDAGTTVEDDTQPSGYVADDTDCWDTNAGVHPGATEIVADGIDQDCDGIDSPASRSAQTVVVQPDSDFCQTHAWSAMSKNISAGGTWTAMVNVPSGTCVVSLQVTYAPGDHVVYNGENDAGMWLGDNRVSGYESVTAITSPGGANAFAAERNAEGTGYDVGVASMK